MCLVLRGSEVITVYGEREDKLLIYPKRHLETKVVALSTLHLTVRKIACCWLSIVQRERARDRVATTHGTRPWLARSQWWSTNVVKPQRWHVHVGSLNDVHCTISCLTVTVVVHVSGAQIVLFFPTEIAMRQDSSASACASEGYCMERVSTNNCYDLRNRWHHDLGSP